jgi:hypothetical protein
VNLGGIKRRVARMAAEAVRAGRRAQVVFWLPTNGRDLPAPEGVWPVLRLFDLKRYEVARASGADNTTARETAEVLAPPMPASHAGEQTDSNGSLSEPQHR